MTIFVSFLHRQVEKSLYCHIIPNRTSPSNIRKRLLPNESSTNRTQSFWVTVVFGLISVWDGCGENKLGQTERCLHELTFCTLQQLFKTLTNSSQFIEKRCLFKLNRSLAKVSSLRKVQQNSYFV